MEAYLQEKLQCAREGFSLRTDSNLDWTENNPEWEWCRQHKTVVRPVTAQLGTYEPTKSCSVCLQEPEPELRPYNTAAEAREAWEKLYSELGETAKKSFRSKFDHRLRAELDQLHVKEWRAWIRVSLDSCSD